MNYPKYEIELLEKGAPVVNIEEWSQIMEISMGTYKIENEDLFASVKDLGQPKALSMEGYQWYAILTEGHQWNENSDYGEGYCSFTSVSLSL